MDNTNKEKLKMLMTYQRLKGNADFGEFIKYIFSVSQSDRTMVVYCAPEQHARINVLQGRIQALESILTDILNTDAKIEEIQQGVNEDREGGNAHV